MNIQQAYAQWAATYDSDQNLTRDLDQVVTRNTLAELHCTSILEIGCGTGKNTAFLADIGERVLAVDLTESMIARAQEKLHRDNVSFAVADITHSWPIAAQSADLVVCNLVLEHIADLSFIFSEAARALVRGGVFFVSELHPFKQYQGTKANFQQGQERTEIQAFVHHISDFLDAAAHNGFTLKELKEWWHPEDEGKPPRLVSFNFEK